VLNRVWTCPSWRATPTERFSPATLKRRLTDDWDPCDAEA